jgi:hypothetical protein
MIKIILRFVLFFGSIFLSYLIGLFFGYPLIAVLIGSALCLAIVILFFARSVVNAADDIG